MIALLVFLAAAAFTFGDLWRKGPSTFVPIDAVPAAGLVGKLFEAVSGGDATFEAWLVGRNAQTLARRPGALFDTEHCAPIERTLTLGVPMLTMSILGIPTQLVWNEPVLTYNVSIVLLILAAAVGAYLVVTDWTGEPVAGIVAGLILGFAPSRLGHITHPSVMDIAWTAYALYFGRRLLDRGRWQDAVGLALAGVLQIWASFYTLLATFFFAPPIVVWLLWHRGLGRLRVAQLVLIGAAVLGAALVLFPPYLETRHALGTLSRTAAELHFAAWSDYLPGGPLYFGTMAIVLASVAVLFRRRALYPERDGDPRLALIVAALVVAAVSTGPNLLHPGTDTPVRWGHTGPLPEPSTSLYHVAARLVPGMDAIRLVTRLSTGALLGVSILAGIGAAGLLRGAGRYRALVTIGLVATTFGDVARPGDLPQPKPSTWTYVEARSNDHAIAFFEALEAVGNRGPLLEVPVATERTRSALPPRRIMLTAHHGRRTSACLSSYRPPVVEELATLSARLPEREAVDRIRALGFTALVVDTDTYWAAGFEARQRRAERRGARALRLIHADGERAAYDLGAG